MNAAQLTLASILLVTLVLQAALPGRRLVVVTGGAALACLAAASSGVSSTPRLLAEVPWDVLVILVALGLLSRLFAESRLFDRLAVGATRLGRGDPKRVLLIFPAVMYVVSGVVNNLTALVLVLPVMLALLKLAGTTQRYVTWAIGLMLVACNLGGAATPIGDFPAILLLGRGEMSFGHYLARAAPATLVGLVALLAIAAPLVRPWREVPRDPVTGRLTEAVIGALHRNVRIDLGVFVPTAVVLAAMVVAWLALPAEWSVGPDLVSWIGASVALVVTGARGERLTRAGLDAEAVLFLLSLFVMVNAVRSAGLFEVVAQGIQALPLPMEGRLVAFLLLAGVLTGLFSAGPSMAAMLEVAETLATEMPGSAVYVGLALSVCAGSSLFLTAATSGPLAQALTERADLRDAHGAPLRFGFLDFLPVGLLSFCVIEAVAIGYALLSL